ncbi:helix-turn-helix domain-containing protein, partial [Sulfurihydrogenibium subterraneum]|uniref:helix-turn-helix domain-containing protein n=1 Tax=Sulfurihydrogenibium subterraneum TaxID=171121 RepID=UPI00056690A9
MKGIIGTPMYITKLFPKKLSNKIKDVPLTREAKKRLKWIQYYQKTKNISKTCRYFKISKNTLYKWLKRYEKDGLEGLYDKPKTPINTRKPTIRNKYKEEVIKIRKENPTWSKEKISAYLQTKKNIKVSPSTIYRILKEAGLIEKTKTIKIQNKRKKDIKKKRTKRGLQAQAPGDVVQIDVKHINITGKTHYQFTAIDKYSRFCFAAVYQTKSSRIAK